MWINNGKAIDMEAMHKGQGTRDKGQGDRKGEEKKGKEGVEEKSKFLPKRQLKILKWKRKG
jgi:hypothetical protein